APPEPPSPDSPPVPAFEPTWVPPAHAGRRKATPKTSEFLLIMACFTDVVPRMILDFVPPRVAALLILLLGCTRPNPAFYPEGPSRDAAAKAAPDAAATAIASLDTAPLPPDTTAPAPDAALSLVFTEVRSSPGVVPASPGGKDFSDECETGQVLTGLVVTSGEPDLNGLNSVQGRCALAAVNT